MTTLEEARKQFKAFVDAWREPMVTSGMLIDYDEDVVIFMKDHSELMIDIVANGREFMHFEGEFSVHVMYDGNDYRLTESVIGQSLDSVLKDLLELYRTCMRQIASK
jgi:hypothetical protein